MIAPKTQRRASATSSPRPAPVVAEHAADVDVIEITTYRSDRYDPDSRKPEVTFGDTLEDDLLRRDFTFNAMARDLQTGEIIDPYGGREDLEHGLIRAVGDRAGAPLRRRPVAHAARGAFRRPVRLPPGGSHRGRPSSGRPATLAKISRERIRDEFTKLLVAPQSRARHPPAR